MKEIRINLNDETYNLLRTFTDDLDGELLSKRFKGVRDNESLVISLALEYLLLSAISSLLSGPDDASG